MTAPNASTIGHHSALTARLQLRDPHEALHSRTGTIQLSPTHGYLLLYGHQEGPVSKIGTGLRPAAELIGFEAP